MKLNILACFCASFANRMHTGTRLSEATSRYAELQPAKYRKRKGRKKSAVDLSWQSVFKEPRLQQLIGLALENNKDLRLATLNVAAAKAQYGIQRSYMLPSVDATISGTRQRGENDTGGGTTSEHGVGGDERF
jgi:multidrug efflux system outer membrane protein